MAFLPVFLLMAQSVSPVQATTTNEVVLPILHKRPSTLLKHMGPQLLIAGLNVVPKDETSTLVLTGKKSDIDEFKLRVELFDVVARKSRLAISISSPIDHASWKGEIETFNNSSWSGTDGVTGIQVDLASRVNADGTCTVFLKTNSEGRASTSAVFRVKLNEEVSITAATGGFQFSSSTPTVMPKITIKYLGESGE